MVENWYLQTGGDALQAFWITVHNVPESDDFNWGVPQKDIVDCLLKRCKERVLPAAGQATDLTEGRNRYSVGGHALEAGIVQIGAVDIQTRIDKRALNSIKRISRTHDN